MAHLWLHDFSCGQKFKMEGIQRFDGGEFTFELAFPMEGKRISLSNFGMNVLEI